LGQPPESGSLSFPGGTTLSSTILQSNGTDLIRFANFGKF
jgi:hypothetical protein